jgi:hypothetical protein
LFDVGADGGLAHAGGADDDGEAAVLGMDPDHVHRRGLLRQLLRASLPSHTLPLAGS